MSVWRALVPRLPSLALIALGVAALYKASSLTLGSARQPGSGFYPTLVCVLLIVFGILSLTDAVQEPRDGVPAALDAAASRTGGEGRVWVVVVAMVAYAWAITPVGFLVSTVALLVLLLRGIGRVSWTTSAVSAVVGSILCDVAFVKLGLPLPAGVLGL
jgi:putative tricarboxylic transport membrane protein